MAIVNYLGLADMSELMAYTAADSVFFVSATEIRIGSPTSYDRYVGTGITVVNGVVTAGTITAFEGAIEGGQVRDLQILQLNLSAATVYGLLASRSGAELKSLALAGFDNITGRNGADLLYGYGGNDMFNAGLGADTMVGGAGSDSYTVMDAGDRVVETDAALATGGSDTVYSLLASYTLPSNVENGWIFSVGTAGMTGNGLANLIVAGRGNNRIDGGAGSDTVRYDEVDDQGVTVRLDTESAQATGSSGTDTLISIENLVGTPNADRLTGNAGANRLEGGAGNDTLDGLAGVDRMVGGDGNDQYQVRNAGDLVIEAAGQGTGTDTVISSVYSYTLAANVEVGRIAGAADIHLTGNAGANRLYSGVGSNIIDGGAGTDVVDYSFATAGVRVTLGRTTMQNTWGSGADTLIRIEGVRGSAYSDNLVGNGGANTLQGQGGDDVLAGGRGNDILSGGSGLDHFRFTTLPDPVSNVDRITDWSSPADTIELDNAVFTAILSDGALPAAAFRVWTATDRTLDSTDRVIFDSFGGGLYYDADGSGFDAVLLKIAQLDWVAVPPTMTAADITII